MMAKIFLVVIFCVAILNTSPTNGYQLTFHPRISFGVEYTDNVRLDPDNIGEISEPLGLEPESDFIFVTAPGFTTEMLGERNGLSLSYDFGYSMYDELSNRDSWRHYLDLSAWSELGRNMRLGFFNTYLYTEDPLGESFFEVTVPPDSEIPADPTTIGSREPYWINTARLRFDHEFAPEESYFLQFSNRHREDDNELGENSTVNIPRAGLTYWFTNEWGTELEGAYTWADYETASDIRGWYSSLKLIRRLSRQLQVYGLSRQRLVNQKGTLEEFLFSTRRIVEDWNAYDFQLGTVFTPSDNLTLELSGGLVYYDPGITDDKTEFAGMLDLTRTFREGSARLYAARGYGESLLTTRWDLGPSLFTEAGLSGTYPLTQHISLNAFISYRKDDYGIDQRALLAREVDPELPPVPEEELERIDDNYGAGAGLTYQLRSWVAFDITYAYRKRDSNLAIDSFNENRATFYITLTTPQAFVTSR
jgi:hypothetical protein